MKTINILIFWNKVFVGFSDGRPAYYQRGYNPQEESSHKIANDIAAVWKSQGYTVTQVVDFRN